MGSLRKPFPLFTTPRFGGDERRRPVAHVIGRHQLAGREDHCLCQVSKRTLIVDAKRGQSVDLVSPQVDTDRGVSSRWVYVDDRAAP